ncbi:MAG: OmpH family outer membrane protein [Candidatus Cryptobacteroides sp.]
MKKIILIAATMFLALAANAQNLSFGYVNFNELIMLMPEMDSAREQLTAAQKEADETFGSMYEEYQTKAQQYQQKAATWSASIKESKEVELQQIQQRIQQFQQDIQSELEELQNKLQTPIVQKAQETVANIAKGKNLSFVFDQTSLIYIDKAQGYDITPDARVALNIPEGRTLETLQAELQAKAQAAAQQ